MKNHQFKHRLISRIIENKKSEVEKLRYAEKQQLRQPPEDDIDFTNSTESPREEMASEALQPERYISFLKDEINMIESVGHDEKQSQIEFGTLVETDSLYFFICVPFDAFLFESITVVGLSQLAPAYESMKGLRPEEQFYAGGKRYTILSLT
jgi:hypothetical protein